MDNENLIITIGFVAGFLTTFAALPQVVRIWRTRKAQDLSLLTYVALIIGIILWIFYAGSIGDLPLLMANIVGLALNLLVFIGKIRYG